MLSRNQLAHIRANSPADFLAVSETALAANGLMWGGGGLVLYTPLSEIDNLTVGDVRFEHNHFSDSDNCYVMDMEHNIWVPTAEKALVDTIAFLDDNYIEGALIESLQNYLAKHDDLSKLYEVADHYNVSRDKVDYWINEAIEEGDMSMG